MLPRNSRNSSKTVAFVASWSAWRALFPTGVSLTRHCSKWPTCRSSLCHSSRLKISRPSNGDWRRWLVICALRRRDGASFSFSYPFARRVALGSGFRMNIPNRSPSLSPWWIIRSSQFPVWYSSFSSCWEFTSASWRRPSFPLAVAPCLPTITCRATITEG